MFPWEKEQNNERKERDDAANRAKQAKWQSRHREENKQKCREYHANNPDYLQGWRAENPDKVKEYSLRQNDTEERKEYMREYMRQYRKAKKEAEKANESAESVKNVDNNS